jgi:hypothetical protein
MEEARPKLGGFFWLCVVVALSCLVLSMANCGSAGKVLSGVHQAGVQAHEWAKGACRPALEKCKREKTNPCPALEKCQKHRRPILKTLLSLQRAVVVAELARQSANEKELAKAVRAALVLADAVRKAIAEWKGGP